MLSRCVRIAALAAVALTCAVGLQAAAQEGKQEGKEVKKGRVIGVVTAKEKNWIEVKAFGEEEPRRYVPQWRGGQPAQGGGLDKKMLETFSKLKVGSRVQVDWLFEERPRAIEVRVLDAEKNEEKDR